MLDKLFYDFTEAEQNQETMKQIEKVCQVYDLKETFSNEQICIIEETIANYNKEFFKLGFKYAMSIIKECQDL